MFHKKLNQRLVNMTTIEHFKKYFALKECVSANVATRFGEQAWSFLDPRLLDVMVWIREGMNIPIVINTTSLQQRGYRENTSQIVKDKTKKGVTYASPHTRGMAFDFSSGKKTAVEIRKWIRANIATCPHPIRLESDKSAPTWVHVDVCNISKQKLVEFNA